MTQYIFSEPRVLSLALSPEFAVLFYSGYQHGRKEQHCFKKERVFSSVYKVLFRKIRAIELTNYCPKIYA
jgi:hypothetical protein